VRRCKWVTIFLMALAILLFPVTSLKTFAAESNAALILDEADLFSQEEEREILDYIATLNPNCHMVVITLADTGTGMSEGQMKSLGFSLYESEFMRSDGVVILFDMENRNLSVLCEGNVTNKISNYRAVTITDNIYKKASKGDFVATVKEGFRQANRYLGGKIVISKMQIASNLFFAAMIALIINFFVLRYTSKMPSVSAESLANAADIQCDILNPQKAYRNSVRKHFKAGSIEAVASATTKKMLAIQIFLMILNILWFIIKAAGSGGGGGSHSGGGRSGGGGGSRSSGSHRF